MPNFTDHLKASHTGLSLSEAVRLPTSALLGVSDAAATALAQVGIETIFDLGSSWLFANAESVTQDGGREPGGSRTPLLEGPALDDAGSMPLDRLRGLADADAAGLGQTLGVATIREFALWPPRRVAQSLVGRDAGEIDGDEAHVEALRPRMGEYPTERVYYKSLVMLGMTDDPNRQPLTAPLSLLSAVGDGAGFGQPAVGALVTLSQSWYPKGITLGHMLHSLALAPGEATRIAVVDWSRRTRTTTSETIEEAEQLDSAASHSRAISEVQNAVASEMQAGGSMSDGWSKSSSSADSSGFSVGSGAAGAYTYVTSVIGWGGGWSDSSQEAETTFGASSTSWSSGNRSVTAEMSQFVNDRTEQHSTSVRNRRASAVREVSQSEHEQVSTRVVANYNHMHALTVQYYEVVQIYRVMVQIHTAQRVLFLPFELLDFSTSAADDLVARFRAQLRAGALTSRVARLLYDDRGEIEIRTGVRVQVPSLFADAVGSGMVATARRIRVGVGVGGEGGGAPSEIEPGSGDSGTVVAAPPTRRVTVPGPIAGLLPGDVELAAVSFDGVKVDRVRFDQAGVPAESSTFAVPDTTFQVDLPLGLPLRNVNAIHLTKTEDAADAGTMTLHYRAGGEQFTLAVPLDLATGTIMQKVAFLAADRSNRKDELRAHLQANQAHYSQAVLRNLDTPTLVMLLSRFTWNGKPLAEQVEPKPLTVAGNYMVLRAPVEPGEPAGIDSSTTTWGQLLDQRSLTSAQHDERLVPIPTGGVFAEAVLGRSNSAEKLDITRFWNWQDSPIPLQPPEIAPVSLGSRGTAEDLRPGQLGSPVLNLVTPTQLPEPTGLGAALTTIAAANLFRDMSGLAGTQNLASAASAGTLSAATEAGRLASANLKTATDQAVAMGQAAADMWKVLQTSNGGGGSGSGSGGGSGSNVSADGARINHGRDMDERGLTGDGGTSEIQHELGAGGGGGGGGSGSGRGGGGGTASSSNERNFANEAATGVSPELLADTARALLGGTPDQPASVDSAANEKQRLERRFLLALQNDLRDSGASLTGIRFHPMRTHPNGRSFEGFYFAWTQSGSDVYIDTELFFKQNLESEEDLLDFRAQALVGLRHELIHVEQFRTTGRPTTYQQMVKYEIGAYGCDPTNFPSPHLAWLNQTGPGGAFEFLKKQFGLEDARAQSILDGNRANSAIYCTALVPWSNVPDSPGLEESTKQGLKTAQLLPNALLMGSRADPNYTIEDLYNLWR